jgi:hypothetical protein
VTRAEKVTEIARLKSLGWRNAEIAAHLGMRESGVRNLINDPDGAKQRERRKCYQGTCETCGASTDGSNGRSAAPRFCAQCAPDAHRIWTREKLIATIRRFASEHGRPPHSSEWNGPRCSGYPSSFTVRYVFGSWANGIEAAGFARPRRGVYDRRAQRQNQVAA